jgi:DNA-binding MarR family transcriptional regulator
MSRSSDTRLLVLHGLRLKGFAEVDPLTELLGLPKDDVVKHLDELQDEGLVVHREGRLTGWQLTPNGRVEQERLLAEELDEAGVRDEVANAYRQFLALNGELLEVCTAWQMRGDAINDHADHAYDSGVIDRLHDLHVQVGPILAELEATLDRYDGYRGRLDDALNKLRRGSTEWFTKPLIDSYHTVWFQLHEDLLNTLGIERSQEVSA